MQLRLDERSQALPLRLRRYPSLWQGPLYLQRGEAAGRRRAARGGGARGRLVVLGIMLLLLPTTTTTTTTKVPPGGAGIASRRRPPLRGRSARSRRAACRRARACDAAHAPHVRAEGGAGGARAQQGSAVVRHAPLLLGGLHRARKRGESLLGRHGGGGAHDPSAQSSPLARGAHTHGRDVQRALAG
eukprot:scaffold20040_cov60-Phaeocystis_antarctica.AAC.1